MSKGINFKEYYLNATNLTYYDQGRSEQLIPYEQCFQMHFAFQNEPVYILIFALTSLMGIFVVHILDETVISYDKKIAISNGLLYGTIFFIIAYIWIILDLKIIG